MEPITKPTYGRQGRRRRAVTRLRWLGKLAEAQERQAPAPTTPEVMLDWTHSRTRRRARVAREYWDAYESGRPMSQDDY